ncbi:hypothetical protein V6N11_033768 [Hibiscus sabdariffa]|uniref:Uncharacterized protein n=1 Tax=Hibiscus sabdariffa TaxID=183260 RepID=A0ABR2S0G0_9ROSI
MWVTTLRQKYHMLTTCPLSIARRNCDGHDVHLWNDTWVPNLGPLWPWLTHASSGIDHMHFADMLQADGNWNTLRLSALLDPVAVPYVIGVLPPSLNDTRDMVAWRCTPTGVFTVASAYESLLSAPWPVVGSFLFELCLVWKRRNDFVFNGECLPLPDIYRIGFVWASHFAATIQDVAMGSHAAIGSIQWVAPPHDWVSLNTDAAISSPNNFGAIGGVLSGPAGAWLRGYCKSNPIALLLSVCFLILWLLVALPVLFAVSLLYRIDRGRFSFFGYLER